MNYQDQGKIINSIYEKYHQSIVQQGEDVTQRKYLLAQLDTEIDKIKSVSLTQISFLQKKLTDLNLSLVDTEDLNYISSKLSQEVSEAEFLLADQLERAKKSVESYDKQIREKQAELDTLRLQYQDKIQRLMQQIQEKELLVGELSGGQLSNKSESYNTE